MEGWYILEVLVKEGFQRKGRLTQNLQTRWTSIIRTLIMRSKVFRGKRVTLKKPKQANVARKCNE